MNRQGDIRRRVWERDRYRCQECGIQVGRRPGLRPHTHHVVPRSLGGSDEERNLITLCQPCHTAKENHGFMLAEIPAVDYPQYVKQSLWDISLKLLYFTETLDPRKFPDCVDVIQQIQKAQQSLEAAKSLTKAWRPDTLEKGIGREKNSSPRRIEDVTDGVRIGWSRQESLSAWMVWIETKKRGLLRKRV